MTTLASAYCRFTLALSNHKCTKPEELLLWIGVKLLFSPSWFKGNFYLSTCNACVVSNTEGIGCTVASVALLSHLTSITIICMDIAVYIFMWFACYIIYFVTHIKLSFHLFLCHFSFPSSLVLFLPLFQSI